MTVRKLLIVDDELELAENLAEILEASDRLVDIATSAEAALELLCTEAYSGLVTDLRLPGASGLELLAQARARGIGLPVVLISACCLPEVAAQAQEAGALDVLHKPIDLQRFLCLVDAIEERHQEVLVVEDNQDLGQNMVEHLRSCGLRAKLMTSGEAALERCTLPSVTVLDIRLPGIGGLEVARRLLARDPTMKLVVVSAYADRALADSVHRLSRDAPVLSKPVDLDRLSAEVRMGI